MKEKPRLGREEGPATRTGEEPPRADKPEGFARRAMKGGRSSRKILEVEKSGRWKRENLPVGKRKENDLAMFLSLLLVGVGYRGY